MVEVIGQKNVRITARSFDNRYTYAILQHLSTTWVLGFFPIQKDKPVLRDSVMFLGLKVPLRLRGLLNS